MSEPLVYIAGPIQAIGKFSAMARNAELALELSRLGIASFDPAAAFAVPEDDVTSAVQNVNKQAIRECDVFVVFWQGVLSQGTDREVVMALEGNLPIVVIQVPLVFGMWENARDYYNNADAWLEIRFPNPGDWDMVIAVVNTVKNAADAVSRIVNKEGVG